MKLSSFIFIVLFSKILFAQYTIKNPQLNIFKNGFVFIQQEYEFDKIQNQYTIPIPEQATSGTYWLLSKNNGIQQIKFQYAPLPFIANDNENVISTLLKNKEEVLKINTQSLKTYFGKTLSLNFIDSFLLFNQLGVVDSIQKIFFSTITKIEILGCDKKNVVEFHIPKVERSAIIIPEYRDKNFSLREYYLRNNMNWYASVLFKLNNATEANLMLRLVIENNLQDFKNANINLLLQDPSIENIHQIDPLVKDRVINKSADFESKENVIRKKNIQIQARGLAAPAMMSMSADNTTEENYSGTIEQLESIANNQVYSFKDISLNKESKNAFIYLNKNIQYKNFYASEIPLTYFNIYKKNTTNTFTGQVNFHIAFQNTTQSYLPNSSIMFLDENEDLIAKKQLAFMAPNASVDFNISQAIDFKVNNKEEIINSVLIKSFSNNQKVYVLTIKGKIWVECLKNGKHDFQLTKKIEGQTETSHTESISSFENFKILPPQNNDGLKTFQWNFLIENNQKKMIEYQYEREQTLYE